MRLLLILPNFLPTLAVMITMGIIGSVVFGMDPNIVEPLLKKRRNADQDQQLQIDHSDQLKMEVIVDDGTTEDADMAKALQLRESLFWRKMMTKWECKEKDENKSQSQEIDTNSIREFVKICKEWKMKAMAANAFVESWKCQENRKNLEQNVSDSAKLIRIIHGNELEQIKDELRCLSVKPRFLVEQGELQLSSAMEAIKAVYRDLFKWGNGKSLKFEIKFENESAWDTFDQLVSTILVRMQKNKVTIGQMNTKVKNIHLLNLTRLAFGDDPNFDGFENSILKKQFSNPSTQNEVYALSDSPDEAEKISILLDQLKQFSLTLRSFTDEMICCNNLECALEKYEKQQKKLQNENLNDEEKLKILKKVKREGDKMWKNAQQFGLDYSTMCESSTKFMEMFGKESSPINVLDHFEEMNSLELMSNKPMEIVLEEIIGILLVKTNDQIHGMMKKMKKNSDELKQFLVPDPCDEAKLKVKKNEMNKADQSGLKISI